MLAEERMLLLAFEFPKPRLSRKSAHIPKYLREEFEDSHQGLLSSKLQKGFLYQERRETERAWRGGGFVDLDLKEPCGQELSQSLLTIQLPPV